MVNEYGRENLLVLCGGDIFVGSTVLNERPILGWTLFSLMDGFVFGNHEFDSRNAFFSNVLLTNQEGFINESIESRAGSGVSVLAGDTRMLHNLIKTTGYAVKTMGNGDRVLLIGVPQPGYGSHINKRKEQGVLAVQNYPDTIRDAFDYALAHPVDHVVFISHDALNNWRDHGKRSMDITKAIADYFDTKMKAAKTAAEKQKIQQLHDMIRVMYEGHSHKPEQNLYEKDGILRLQGAGKGEPVIATPVTVFERIPGQSTYVSSQLINLSDEKSFENENGVVAAIYDNLYKDLLSGLPPLTQVIVRFSAQLRRAVDLTKSGLRRMFVDASAPNSHADVLRKRSKDLFKRTAMGKNRIKGNKYYPKEEQFSFATPENSGKTPHELEYTYGNIADHYAGSEPLAIMEITGENLRKFIEFGMRAVTVDGKEVIVPLGSFAHNLRIAYDSRDMEVEEVDGFRFARLKRLRIYTLQADNKYYPLNDSPDKMYSLSILHHLAEGYYEGRGIENFLELEPLYVEEELTSTALMSEYLPKVALERLRKMRVAPRPFYDKYLPAKFTVPESEIPDGAPLFVVDEGRFFDLNYLREEFGIELTDTQLDDLYAGRATLEDLFGPLQRVQKGEDVPGPTSWLPSDLGGNPAGLPAGTFLYA